MKLDIKNKELKINISKVLNNNKIDFKKMSESDQLKYVLSHYGYKQKGLSVPKKYSKNDHNEDMIINRQKNYFLNLQKDLCKIGDHRPLSNLKYFGIEIECLIPYDSLGIYKDDYGSSSSGERECSTCEGSRTITCTHRDSGHETEIDCPDCEGTGMVDNDDSDPDNSDLFYACKTKLASKIKALNIRGIDIKQDGSIDDDIDELWPVEITILVRQDDLSALKKLCDLLNDLKAEVNSSCGLHVHVDMRGQKAYKVAAIGKKFERVLPFLSNMVPKSRRNNRFCRLSVSKLNGSDRYHAVNLLAFNTHNTIEIRLHSSTTSFLKISNWIKVLSLIMQTKKPRQALNSTSDFINYIKADNDLHNYIISRVQKFGGTEEESTCEAEEETTDVSQTEMVA